MQTCRVWAVSDLHTDYAINMNLWARGMDSTNTQKDVLLLAGDVCDDLATLEETLALLCAKFQHVFYVVGNHELWVRESDR
jgi:predicted MPP superfamily phosphohydrolase